MPLTDDVARNATPRQKKHKLFDGGGMFLLIMPNGRKLWRIQFRVNGRENQLSLGTYPEVSLEVARIQRTAIRTQLARGQDPSALRKEHKRQPKKPASGLQLTTPHGSIHIPTAIEPSAKAENNRLKRGLAAIFDPINDLPPRSLTAAQEKKLQRNRKILGRPKPVGRPKESK